MFLSGMRKMLGLAVLLVAFASATTVFAQTGGLTGTAKDEKGEILAGYWIIIERQDVKGTYKVKTNKKGEYVYIGLPIGNYKVSLQDPNGRTLFFVSQHVGLGDPTEVIFDLAKEKAVQQKEQQANPEVQKQLEQQKKEEKQLGGLKQLYDQGNALIAEKKYVEAATVFEQAIPLAKEKNVPLVLGRLADCYQKARQFDKAVETYGKAIAAKPDDATLHNNLGNAYAEMNKIPEAQAEFQKAAELDPTGASRYYFNLGVTMYNRGRMDEAAQALKKATDLDPNFADGFFWQGLALMGKATTEGDKVVVPPGTAEALQAYLKIEPNGKNAAAAQQMLLTIQGKVQTEFKAEKKKKKG